MEERNGEIAAEKIDNLLKMYAEKVNDGQTSMASGIRFAMKYLGVVTDEDIHFALSGEKPKRKYKKRK